jgi:hypothetical protein
MAESGNFALMSKVQIHIGKKIREVLDKTPISVVDFAKSINLTRNGAYKVFEKETIDTGQLQTISKVLNHDFFSYYEQKPSAAKETNPEYGYATKSEVADLAHMILKLTRAVERIEERLPVAKSQAKKTAPKKKPEKK